VECFPGVYTKDMGLADGEELILTTRPGFLPAVGMTVWCRLWRVCNRFSCYTKVLGFPRISAEKNAECADSLYTDEQVLGF